MSDMQMAVRRRYETVYILRPTVTKEAADRVNSRVDEVIKREGGTLTRVETWGRRNLAFRKHGHRRGVYLCLSYVGSGPLVSELERNLRMLDDVLQYQTIRRGEAADGDAVNPDDVQFEAIAPEDEEEETREAALGLDFGEQRQQQSDDDAGEGARGEGARGEGAKTDAKAEEKDADASEAKPAAPAAEENTADDAAEAKD